MTTVPVTLDSNSADLEPLYRGSRLISADDIMLSAMLAAPGTSAG